jgi:hypothetical protein
VYRFTARTAGTTAALFNVAPSGALDVGSPQQVGSISQLALDPIAGVRQGRSVMSLFVFGPGVAGTPTAGLTTATATLLADQNPPRQ